MKWLRLNSAALMLVIVGVGALIATGVQLTQTARFLTHATWTQGTVLRASAHPVIRFSTEAGTSVQFTQNGFLTRPVGAQVRVVYAVGDPAGTARAATFWTIWGAALWWLPMGLGFTVLPLMGAEVTWRWGRF